MEIGHGRWRRATGAGGRGLACVTVMLAVLGVVPSLAAASPPRGALVAVSGAGGCLGHGCATGLRPFGQPRAGRGPLRLVVGDSGRLVYAVQHAPAVIDILRRDPGSGALTQLPGGRGCLSARALSGCRRVAAMFGHRVSVRGDGTIAVSLGHRRRRLLRRDPLTGLLRAIGVRHGCLAALDGPCVAVRGVVTLRRVLRYAPGSALITGYGRRGVAGMAIVHRDPAGGWHAVPGPTGCATSDGSHGCTKLPCLHDAATAAQPGFGGGLLYVGGGSTDLEFTEAGYLATFRVTAAGGLASVGCRLTGGARVPAWLATAPDGHTMLVAQVRGNRGDGIVWERIYAAQPGPDGALGTPRPISGDLQGVLGSIALGAGGHALYDAGGGSGSLQVERVTPRGVRQMGTPYGIAYHASRPFGLYGATGFTMSRDQRFLYLATAVAPFQGIASGPSIRAYRVAR